MARIARANARPAQTAITQYVTSRPVASDERAAAATSGATPPRETGWRIAEEAAPTKAARTPPMMPTPTEPPIVRLN
jgi:hypothetical protein